MLKEDWKQNLVLVLFCFLMKEVLTSATIVFVAVGIVLVFMNLRPGKVIRNVLAVAVFASYWFKYGKLIDPEIGVNFLTSIIMLKILEKETVRDRYMIFFGLILLISAGSLFERTLTYVFFFSLSFLILIRDFYSYLGQKIRIKDLGIALVWVLPLTFLLFFTVPRLLNPIPFNQNTVAPGEIGYTPDVNISEVESLEPNQTPVFQVVTSRSLYQKELYWRGNTLSFTDGWNWKEMIQDREEPEILLGVPQNQNEVKQSFRLYSNPEYFFTMDYPSTVVFGRNVFGLKGHMKTISQRSWDWVQRYDVYSNPGNAITEAGNSDRYLIVPLSKKEKEFIKTTFKGDSFNEIVTSIKLHFIKEKFSYSLSPGKIASFKEFLQKKVGFCSHYASAAALILRAKGIPGRLVSGFMGGEYNKFADFYLVSQNDAHVWVEAYVDNKWIKFDPTEWIAPDRVLLGGEAFMETVRRTSYARKSLFKLPPFFTEMRQWLAQWDFHFYQWLEEMDYYSQDAWLSYLKIKREWLFSLIPLMMVSFMLIYTWFLSNRINQEDNSPHQNLWNMFYKKMHKKGLRLSRVNMEKSREMLESLKDEKSLAIWTELYVASFQGKKISFRTMKKKIRNL
jgi:protein-glutamine gamma-glutamyltransferase